MGQVYQEQLISLAMYGQSQPIFCPAGTEITVKMLPSGSLTLDYTNDTAANVYGGLAVWNNSAVTYSVSSVTATKIYFPTWVRLNCLSGLTQTTINPSGNTILPPENPFLPIGTGSSVPSIRAVSASTDTLLAADADNIVQYSANATVTVPLTVYGLAPITVEALAGVTLTWAAGTGVTTLLTPAPTLVGYGSAVVLSGPAAATFDVFGTGGLDVRNGGGFYASTVANGVWISTFEAPWSGYFTKTTTGCKSGTCTMNVNIGATSYTLGSGGSVTGGTNLGAANSVTSTKTDVAQTTGNTFTTGQLVTVIVSANASCLEAYLQLTAVRTGP